MYMRQKCIIIEVVLTFLPKFAVRCRGKIQSLSVGEMAWKKLVGDANHGIAHLSEDLS